MALYQRTFIHILLALVLCTSAAAAPSPLAKRISISAQNESVQSVLKHVETLAGVKIMYNSQILAGKQPVSISAKDVTVRRALQLIINDGNLLFYELDKYIVIAQRRDVPQGVLFQKAIAQTAPEATLSAVNDTLLIYDTVQVVDSVHTTVSDTLRIFDTVRIERPKTKEPAKKTPSRLAVSAELMPAYHTALGNSQSLGQIAFSGQAMIIRKQKYLDFGAGLGIVVQRGAMQYNYQQETVDSTLHEATKTVVHRYETGRYYYVNGSGQTVTQILYDSVSVPVTYQWYTRERTAQTAAQTVRHQIIWLSLPIRASLHTEAGKKIDAGISLTLSPAMAVQSGGSLILSDGSIAPAGKQTVAAFTVFASIAPSISYRIGKQAQVFAMPTMQMSAASYIRGEHCTAFMAGLSIGTVISLGK